MDGPRLPNRDDNVSETTAEVFDDATSLGVEQLPDGDPTEIPALVFFTDLLGAFPEEPPAYPTLWIHTWPGPPQANVPFGEVIHMPRLIH